jgi:hypothetical protein
LLFINLLPLLCHFASFTERAPEESNKILQRKTRRDASGFVSADLQLHEQLPLEDWRQQSVSSNVGDTPRLEVTLPNLSTQPFAGSTRSPLSVNLHVGGTSDVFD